MKTRDRRREKESARERFIESFYRQRDAEMALRALGISWREVEKNRRGTLIETAEMMLEWGGVK